jgi:hypothetical protein
LEKAGCVQTGAPEVEMVLSHWFAAHVSDSTPPSDETEGLGSRAAGSVPEEMLPALVVSVVADGANAKPLDFVQTTTPRNDSVQSPDIVCWEAELLADPMNIIPELSGKMPPLKKLLTHAVVAIWSLFADAGGVGATLFGFC